MYQWWYYLVSVRFLGDYVMLLWPVTIYNVIIVSNINAYCLLLVSKALTLLHDIF